MAIAALLLLQLPPLTASVNVIVDPVQTLAGPLIVPAVGAAVIVTAVVADAVPQLLVTVYVIVAVPADTPLTTPVALLMLAIVGELLLHVPPLVVLVSVVVAPTHAVVVPLIVPANGSGSTVMV